MSKFRARQLDASKPISIYLQEDITDFTDYNNVTNRTVPQLPTGMEKEEETEHHLQQAIFNHQVIPVPEVYDSTKSPNGAKFFERLYPSNYKIPKQMIHIHPFSAEQDIPDYDLDSEDEEWLREHANKGELLPLDASQFEEMMDRLEKASGLKAVTLQEAKLLLKDDDDLITAVFDYWLNKRLRIQHALIPQVRKMPLVSQVKSEKCAGSTPTDPYVAFRKRTEKMQTRKNRKNDETSYEKMLKLRRDLLKAGRLLEMVKRREKSKRELLHLSIEIFEKRNEMEDFSGVIYNELAAQRLRHFSQRPVFSSHLSNQLHSSSMNILQSENEESLDQGDINSHMSWRMKSSLKIRRREEGKRERRPHKKRRRQGGHLQVNASSSSPVQIAQSYTHPPDVFTIATPFPQDGLTCIGASEDELASASHSEAEDETNLDGPFAFKRKPHVSYHAPHPFISQEKGGPSFKGGGGDPCHNRFSLVSISQPVHRFIGFGRRRVGRGGIMWLDRSSTSLEETGLKCDIDDFTYKCDKDNGLFGLPSLSNYETDHKKQWPHFHPSSQLDSSEDSEDVEVDVETVSGVPSLSFHSPSRIDAISGSSLSGSKENRLAGAPSPPSSFYITAEVAEGPSKGAFTSLQISLPPSDDLDPLFVSEDVNNDSLLLGENLEEVDILSTECPNSGTGGSESSRTSSSNGKISQIVTSQSDLLTSGNSVISDNKSGDSLGNSENYVGSNGSSSSSRLTLSGVYNSAMSSQHSNLEFQTQPSSKFYTSDNSNLLSATQVVTKHPSCPAVSNLNEEPPGCPPHSNSSLLNSSQSSSFSHSFYNTIVKNVSEVSSSSCSSSCSSPSSISIPSLPTTIVSSSLVTSLSNSLCASQNYSVTKSQDNSSLQEVTTKKLSNHSSIYLNRQPKDNNLPFHSLQVSSSLLPNKNGNTVLNNTNSNLVPQKILSTWSGESGASDDNSATVITNGPSNKALGKSKCAKVTQIIFHET